MHFPRKNHLKSLATNFLSINLVEFELFYLESVPQIPSFVDGAPIIRNKYKDYRLLIISNSLFY